MAFVGDGKRVQCQRQHQLAPLICPQLGAICHGNGAAALPLEVSVRGELGPGPLPGVWVKGQRHHDVQFCRGRGQVPDTLREPFLFCHIVSTCSRSVYGTFAHVGISDIPCRLVVFEQSLRLGSVGNNDINVVRDIVGVDADFLVDVNKLY